MEEHIPKLNRKFVDRAIKQAEHEGYRLSLWNGLPATIYRLDSEEMATLISKCPQVVPYPDFEELRRTRWMKAHHVLKVLVKGETLYLITLQNLDPDYLIVAAHFSGKMLLEKVTFYVYANIRYLYTDAAAKALATAIKRRMKPSIAALVTCGGSQQ